MKKHKTADGKIGWQPKWKEDRNDKYKAQSYHQENKNDDKKKELKR
jgi:hypothetical protein